MHFWPLHIFLDNLSQVLRLDRILNRVIRQNVNYLSTGKPQKIIINLYLMSQGTVHVFSFAKYQLLFLPNPGLKFVRVREERHTNVHKNIYYFCIYLLKVGQTSSDS